MQRGAALSRPFCVFPSRLVVVGCGVPFGAFCMVSPLLFRGGPLWTWLRWPRTRPSVRISYRSGGRACFLGGLQLRMDRGEPLELRRVVEALGAVADPEEVAGPVEQKAGVGV